ncbi:hypothetical protein B296_00057693 [Ensete ventricosum]|uniref:Transposase (putative) gypsy type domain-containing protein n=1 Tax=Ensete ventricosum TaxID=4639 RepID=A0A426X2Y0_ENSVE|nr:hypothetical protein B296_00057693 [Ensete ventricosum]
MVSSPLFLVSSFSSAPSSPVPPPREEEYRSSGSLGNQSGPESSSSGVMARADAKALQALEAMKSHHDFDSTMSLESLASIRKHFNISNEYVLHALGPGQRPYHPCPGGFSISIDALEAGLRFPFHPVIGEYLRWWRVSPGQVAPNSWRYIITFLGECKGSGIVSTRDLFLSCFHLCGGQGGYYLTSRVGFRVGGASSNNKGWKAQFLFVSRRRGWDFGIEWSAHPVRNVPPNLSDDETNLIGQLKVVMSASQAIRSLTKEWLVKVGHSPASRGMPCLFTYDMMRGNPRTGGGVSRSCALNPGFNTATSSPRKADRVATKGKGPADVPEEPWASRRKSKSVRELYSASAGVDGRDYHVIRMCNIPEKALDAPLEADLRPLTHGILLATDLYTLPSEVLMDGVAKAMVLVITSLDSKLNLLHQEVQDLKEGGDPDAVTATEVRASEALLGNLQQGDHISLYSRSR